MFLSDNWAVEKFMYPFKNKHFSGRFFKTGLMAGVALLAIASPALLRAEEPPSAPAIDALQVSSKAPVDFQAKQLEHDDAKQTVTATGDVELTQGNKILRADKMVYHLDTDTVQAIGNVSLLEEDGSVYFSEYVELSRNMKDGFVQGLLAMLADGSRFTAAESKRENGKKLTMTEASHTPCKVCEADPHPVWQIRADKVVHDTESKEVKYKNARLEFLGVPVAYTPIFSHADPSVKQKSGFLRPKYGWSNNVGTFVEGGYYFGIAPDKDATLWVRPTTLEGTLVQGQWRQRFDAGRIEVNGSAVQSTLKKENGDVRDGQTRGHIFANGLFDITDTWRGGFDLRRVSDKEYLRLYGIDKSNTLESQIYGERFSGRDYSRIAAISIQDVRLGDRPEQPTVVPLAEHRMVGEPQSVLGGRWDLSLAATGLNRKASGQDVAQANVHTGWERRDIHSSGILTTYDAGFTGDLYSVHNSLAAVSNPALDNNPQTARGSLDSGFTNSYPMVKRLASSQMTVEPLVGVRASTRVNNSASHVPNEDSLDVQIDANNLFDESRFPGDDRREDGARVDYGVRTGLHGDKGGYVKSFVGQSYRMTNDSLFPEGSGLEDRLSDFVGQVGVGWQDRINADYRIQLDNETLAAHRHEAEIWARMGRLTVDSQYIFLDTIDGTGFTEPREQWQVGGEYQLSDHWTMKSSSLLDFGNEPGLRKTLFGISYQDECFGFATEAVRNLFNEGTGESANVIMMRFSLKNIGDFQAPDISLKPQAKTTTP